ncbi:MAG: contractile injection system protein, VgrG/Pvc8 family, partial [Byssovorax sp.]
GLSTYELTLVPALWLLSQRRGNRLFQHVSIPDIVDRVLAEWSLVPVWRIARDQYPRLELRVQYGESDLDFVRRLLEEAGISFYFADDLEKGSQLVFHDDPQGNTLRVGLPIPFLDSPGQAQAGELEFVSEVRVGHQVRPGRFTLRDMDFRRPRRPIRRAATSSTTTRPAPS